MKKIAYIAILIIIMIIDPINTCGSLHQHTSPAGLNLVKSFEGYRSKAYKCPAGVWTIGYGTTRGVKSTMRIDKIKATALLKKDIIRFENIVKRKIKRPLDWHEFDALTSFSYNLGNRFKGDFLKYLQTGDMIKAGMKMKLYCKARVGGKLKVLRGLQRRRNVEVAFLLDNRKRIISYFPEGWLPKNELMTKRVAEMPYFKHKII